MADPEYRIPRPPWVPSGLRLRPPRVRVSHHAAHHATTWVGLTFVYCAWAGLAVLVGTALLFWWCLLAYYWMGVGLWLGACWATRAAIVFYADHRPAP